MKGINSLQSDKYLDCIELKVSAENKIYLIQKSKLVPGGGENSMEKRKKCWLPAFSLF